MAAATNGLFDSARQAFLTASQGWLAGSVPGSWVAYIVSSYNLNQAADVFLSDIPFTGNMWKSGPIALANKTVTAGVADADDITVTAVGSAGAATAHGIVLVNQTNASNTSLLGAYIGDASGLPFQPNGADVSVVWANTANRIFKL